MRPPTPGSLLVEHPALPHPLDGPVADQPTIRIASLDRSDRVRIAAQMVALTGLLADFELWPGRWALHRSVVVESDAGLQIRLPALPLPLTRIWLRLGGGDSAAEATRRTVLSTIAERTRLDPADLGVAGDEPGFFLDGVLENLLGDLAKPLDEATARSLWMLRWSMPPFPDAGDTGLISVPDEDVAGRLGMAMWSAVARRGVTAIFETVGRGNPDLRVNETNGGERTSVLAGDFDDATITTIIDRGRSEEGTLVMVGRFPDGWDPTPTMIFDSDAPASHLTAMGVSPGRRQRFFDRLTGRFDPFSNADRSALTRSAASLFANRRPGRSGAFEELVRVAGLIPEGVPVEKTLELANSSRSELDTALGLHVVGLRQGRVVLQDPPEMVVDPRHGELETLFDATDPRRRLHRALATGDPGPVLAWARKRLDRLDPWTVRRAMRGVAIGELGPGGQVVLAEACLSLADIGGARRALAGLSEEMARPWSNWLRLVDRRPELEVEPPKARDIRHAPRAVAEVALVGLRRALRWDPAPMDESLAMIREALEHLNGGNRRWVEIRLTAQIRPESLDDASWRRSVTGGHPELLGLVLFERSVVATFDDDLSLARRLLRRVLRAERAPGRRAFMELNLGAIAAEEGRHHEAASSTLGAYRLFQVAGFQNRLVEVLHNLAVSDIDQLRVDRAASRLDAVTDSDDSLFVEVERARLALAVGNLRRFRESLVDLPSVDGVFSSQIISALSFLYGVDALLFGTAEDAEKLLQAGGKEGEGWLELASAVRSDVGRPASVPADGWGVGRAAALARTIRGGGAVGSNGGLDPDSLTIEEAFAVALCSFFALRPEWPPRRLRAAAAEMLHHRGIRGWARRLRWSSDEIEDLLSGLSCLVNHRGSETGTDAVMARFLPLLGVDGLSLRSVTHDRELWKVGNGEPRGSELRGDLELTWMGSEPMSGPAWVLVGDILDLLYPTGAVDESATVESDVRLDGVSEAAKRLRGEIRRAAVPRYTVLIHGETGSGKEVVAREIHRLSGRAGALVSVNVAAVAANLLEAELFGSVKGAFTGADRSRRGLVRAAEGGTLFLDEVGDLDVALQVKLLRFLESREVRPVGSDRTQTMDVRVICATHRNLERRVREGRFREDLYYRIAVAKIEVPPLRDRPEDIPILRSIFERHAAQRDGLPISGWSRTAERKLVNHRWPGNVRELKHTVEVAMARANGRTIRSDHLPLRGDREVMRGTWEETLGRFKQRFLTEVLARHRGNRSSAARELGISRQALLYQIKKLELEDL